MSASSANNRSDFSACDNIGDGASPYHDRTPPQVSTTGTSAGSLNGTNGIGNISPANLSNDTRPRWDQRPLAPSASGDGLTLTHDTESTESVYETVYEYDEDGVAVPTQQKKKNMASSSVRSYSSSGDMSQFVKTSHGRTFNTLNDIYLLPSDETEWSRLNKQHIAQVIAMGDLTPCQDLVDAVLAPEEGVEKKVLDLGCGTGVWAIEMARKYPHTSVTGLDVAPVPFDASILPAQLTFEIDDINEGLEHLYGQFDVVHMRCVQSGLRDIDRTLKEVQMCAKPGGLVIVIDGDGDACDEDRLHVVKIPDIAKEGPASPGSWFRKIMWEVDRANQLAGANPRRAALILDSGLWNYPVCDPVTIASGEYFLPIGPWPKVPDFEQTQKLIYAGSLMRQIILNIHRAWHPNLLRFGMQKETLDEWSRKIDEEIGETKLKLWARFRFTYGRRRAAPDQPAPPLSSPRGNQGTQSSQPDGSQENPAPIKYPYINYFKTAEEAARNIEQRRAAFPTDPESECERAWFLKQMGDNA